MNNLQRRLQIHLTEQHYKRLEEMARKKGCSKSELVRQAIEAAYMPSSTYRALSLLARLDNDLSPPLPLLLKNTEWQQLTEYRRSN